MKKRHEVIQPEDSSIKLIALTQGQNAIVDAADYEWLMQWNWTALWSPRTRSFYAVTNMRRNGKFTVIRMHNFIMGEPKEVDHVCSGQTLDNRRSNLRGASSSQNAFNRRKRADNKSGFKGVHWHPPTSKWIARIQSRGKRIHLGCFSSKEEAHAAYREAAQEHHGEFARVA